MEFAKYLENLVNLSLMTKSTSIAIRIHFRNKRLQIIDNGIGIPYDILQLIGDEFDVNKDHENFIKLIQKNKYIYEYWHQVLSSLRVCASTTLIMTKHHLSENTYFKILKLNYSSSIKQMKNRPTFGTTYTIYFTCKSKVLMKILNYKSIMKRLLVRAPQVSYSVIIDDDNKKYVFGKKKFSGGKSIGKLKQSRSYFQRTYYPTLGKFIAYSPGKISKHRSFIKKNDENIKLNEKIKSILKTAHKNKEKSNDENKNRNNNNKNNERQCSFTITSLRSHNAFNHNKDTKNITKDNNNIINDNKNLCSFTTMNIEQQTELNNDDNNIINYSNNNNININCDKKKYSFTITSSSGFNHKSGSTDIFNDKINTTDLNDNQKQYAFIQTGLESQSKLNNDDNLNSNKLDDKNDHTNVEKICVEVNPYDLDLSGEWSDWILESPENQLDKKPTEKNDNNYKTINRKRYSFLPEKLNNLLPKNNNKLLTRPLSDTFREKCNLKFNLPRRQDDDVRLCNVKYGKDEITMDKKILQQIKVLNQVNLEFIACIAEYNNKKLLILIDQHAMHERIRYENLIDDYKTESNKLKSVALKQSIKITELPIDYTNLLQTNRSLLANFGINFSFSDDNITNNSFYKSHDYATLLVTTIPKCLSGRKYKNCIDFTHSVRELLNEIVEKLCNNIGVNRLPLTIHNAIASEACHGAIRFGDPLNLKQCNDLVSYWIETDLPNRCAHGRPVVIPLLFIDPLYRNQHNLTKKRLNFESLQRRR